MRFGSSAFALVLAAYFAPACSSSKSDCVCTVVNGGAERVLACGSSACIGGTTVSCANQQQIVPGGACSAPAPTNTGGEPPPDAGGETDHSCDDLETFCSTMCTAPPNVAADCQSTATAGDASECAEWQLAEGALCSQ